MDRRILILGTLLVFICCSSCNIHRTISGNSKHCHRTRLNFPDELIEEIEEDEGGLLDRILQKGTISWLYAIPASILVGSTGIFPLVIFYNCPCGTKLNEAISPAHLRLLLSFSVGGLFGDVFLHLLPEAWMYLDANDHFAASRMGLWIIGGLLCFLLIEKIFSIHEELNEKEETKKDDDKVESEKRDKEICETSKIVSNGHANGYANGHANGYANGHANACANGHANACANGHANGYVNGVIKRKLSKTGKEISDKTENTLAGGEKELDLGIESVQGKKIIGYLNLLANCIDNFTHGLAVAGSFVVSAPVGLCTTLAILLHEIPHEIGDFAILLKAGFGKWEAAKGQVITASGALVGCLFGLLAEGAGDASSWVLPFTSGGFIYIACVTIIPDLLKETSLRESLKQMAVLFAGIATMGVVSVIH